MTRDLLHISLTLPFWVREGVTSKGFEHGASGLAAVREPGSALFSIDAGHRSPFFRSEPGRICVLLHSLAQPFLCRDLHAHRVIATDPFLCGIIFRCEGATRTEIRDFAVGSLPQGSSSAAGRLGVHAASLLEQRSLTSFCLYLTIDLRDRQLRKVMLPV